MPVGDSAPVWAKRAWLRFIDWYADRAVGPEFNVIRRELGLAPVDRIFNEWLVYSPDVTIGMFPEWFAPRQPDWPASLHLTGFPLYDASDQVSIGPELEEWLASGDPPVVFAPGSANVQAAGFLESAIDVSTALGIRSLLLAPNATDVPADLPDTIRHEEYVPFGSLLPRCRALVSHGGIGTCAQGLAAGIPQLVTHLNFDQRDNGSRLEDLGAGTVIPMAKFNDQKASRAVESILDADTVSQAQQLAKLIHPAEARNAAADQIEAAASSR
jgi:UDP:flavonoid glycosyltransferase YjiC (YdhE family)